MSKLSIALIAALSILQGGLVSARCKCNCGAVPSGSNGTLYWNLRQQCEAANRANEVYRLPCGSACSNICQSRFGVGSSCGGDCIDANTMLFSCDIQDYVSAASVKPGEHIRTLSSEDNADVCSEVYYTFAHEGISGALEVELEDFTKVTVSDNHLLYTGSTFASREATMAKHVKIGDKLVSSDGSAKAVLSVKDTAAELVNVLTMEGSIELENGVIISTHSFNENLYSAAFYPIKMMYKWIGAPAVKKAQPYLVELEFMFKPYFSVFAESI